MVENVTFVHVVLQSGRHWVYLFVVFSYFPLVPSLKWGRTALSGCMERHNAGIPANEELILCQKVKLVTR